MNRSFLPVVALALASLFLVQCKKEDKNMVFDFNFYTSQSTAKMFLYVDDAPKGILPYFAQQPTCGSVSSDGVAPLAPEATGLWAKTASERCFLPARFTSAPTAWTIAATSAGR